MHHLLKYFYFFKIFFYFFVGPRVRVRQSESASASPSPRPPVRVRFRVLSTPCSTSRLKFLNAQKLGKDKLIFKGQGLHPFFNNLTMKPVTTDNFGSRVLTGYLNKDFFYMINTVIA